VWHHTTTLDCYQLIFYNEVTGKPNNPNGDHRAKEILRLRSVLVMSRANFRSPGVVLPVFYLTVPEEKNFKTCPIFS
jgi:hypothetical protein